MMPLSDCETMVAELTGGADGGGRTDPHDAALTFHSSVMTDGPAAVGGGVFVVGAVGEFELEHPIANSNMKAHSVRFTAESSLRATMARLPTEAQCDVDVPTAARRRRPASRGESAMLHANYSDVVPAVNSRNAREDARN
jgi:hypothetical protein